MTSTWGTASTGGRYHLLTNSIVVGDWVLSYKTEMKLITDVMKRHNFWATTVKLDGSYPALVYEHSFQIYKESLDYKQFAQWFTGLYSLYQGSTYSLQLTDGANADYLFVDYGSCYFQDGPRLKTPDELLMFSAGLTEFKFVGSAAPTIIVSPL